MSKAAGDGADTVDNLKAQILRNTSDINTLKDDILSLHSITSDLIWGLKLEEKSRENDISGLHDRVCQERIAEVLMIKTLEKRQTDFEATTKKWVGALAQETIVTKEQLADLDVTLAEGEALNDTRLEAESGPTPTCTIIAHLKELDAEVAKLKASLHRDHLAAAAAVRSAAAAAADDFKLETDRVVCLQHRAEVHQEALARDLSNAVSKFDAIDAFVHGFPAGIDFKALQDRVCETGTCMEGLASEIAAKAATATVNSISERLTSLTMDVHTYKTLAQVDKESFDSQLNAIQKALAKLVKQVDSDRSSTSACLVALEREISAKAAKGDAAAAEKESRAVRHDKQIQMNTQEVPALRARVEAMEIALSSKADVADLSRLSLAIADHQARHEAAHVRLLEQEEHIQKASADFSLAMYHQFYSKEEVDTKLKQLWWRFKNSSEVTLTINTLPNRTVPERSSTMAAGAQQKFESDGSFKGKLMSARDSSRGGTTDLVPTAPKVPDNGRLPDALLMTCQKATKQELVSGAA